MTSRLAVIALLASVLGSGCLVASGDARCSEDQHADNDVCVCDEGFVPSPTGAGCEPCPEHSQPVRGECVCDEGYRFDPAARECTLGVPGQGDACGDGGDCLDTAPLCVRGRDGGSYCTEACDAEGDCASGYACEETNGDRYCTRQPTGRGVSCEEHADCEGYEADYCSITEVCVVSGCGDDVRCHGGWSCCDFAAYGVPTLCVPPELIEEDACPLGVPMLGEEVAP